MKNLKYKKGIKIGVSIGFGILASVALLSDVTKTGFYNIICSDALILFLVGGGLSFFFYQSYGNITLKLHGGILIGSVLFATLNLLGKCLYFSDNLDFLETGITPSLIWGGYVLLFYTIVADLYEWFDRHFSLKYRKSEKSGKFWGLMCRNPFLFSSIFIFICWLPWLIVFYPGCIGWDLFVQLDEVAGIYPLSNRHPVLTSWIAYVCVKLGQFIWSDNLGIFLYFIIRALICSSCYGYCVSCLVKQKKSKMTVMGTLLFYGPNPVFAVFSVTQHKDTWFAAFTALTIMLLITWKKDSGKKIRECLFFSGALILTCLTRHNGIYVILPVCILLAIFVYRDLRYRTTVLLAVLFVFSFNKILLPAIGVNAGSSREAFSIPFQQTARCVRDCAEEITEEEKQAINKVLKFDKLAEVYNPMLSDPVKGSMCYGEHWEQADEEEKKDRMISYLKVWGQMFWKHPIKYLEATISNSSGYYTFVPKTTVQQLKGNTNGGMSFCLYISQTEAVDTKFFTFRYPSWSEKIRKTFTDIANNFEKIPLVGSLYSCALYTWILLLLMGYMIRHHRWKELILFVPFLLSLLVCIASPVDDSFRYFLPIVGMTPLCLVHFDEAFKKF